MWSNRVLVSHASVPSWQQVSIRGVAYHEHLYTRVRACEEIDDVERWLDSDFESSAAPVIEKVVAANSLSRDDWKVLICFFAAQDVRTPARLVEGMERWAETLPDVIKRSLRESVAKLDTTMLSERAELKVESPTAKDLPFRVSIYRNEEKGRGWFKAETISERGLWLWSMRHVLENTVKFLLPHRWAIVEPPDGMDWLTSDDPAI